MDVFFKYINCCKKEDLIKNQTNCEINVPLDNTNQNNCNNSQNISLSQDKPELNKYMDASIVKTSEAINTFNTINENNNNNINNNNINNNINANNNTITNTTEEIVNNNSSNKNNNKHLINNNITNTQNETRCINKVDTFEIQSQQDFLFCNKKKNLHYSNIIPDIHLNNNKDDFILSSKAFISESKNLLSL